MAVRVTPGQIVASGDWDALFTQHGGMSEGTPATRRARNEAEMKAAALAGDQDPAAQQRPIYRYVLVDGSYVDARTSPDGQGWEVVDYQPTQAFTQAQTKAAAVENRTPEETRIAAANATTAELTVAEKQAEANERAAHVAAGHGNYTDKEWAAEEARQAKEKQAAKPGRVEEPVPGKPGVKVVKTTDPATNQTETHYEDAAGNVIPTPAAPAKPPTNVSAPSNQRFIEDRTENPDGSYTITPRKNPNWKPESKVVRDESSGKWVQITETDEGGYTIKPVDDQTTIKPADLPVLQAKYGEISQGLGALAADLNGKFARGEITEKQKNDAFAAGHQQASTQISEINTILTNSQSAWRQEIEQRGQTLSDTAGRRTFAGNVFQNALSTGERLAISSGPGHGAAIAGGVAALMGIGQRYAEGMGGLRESPEIAMPAAVRQARDVNLPGFGPGAAAPVSGSGFPVSGAAGPGVPPGVPPAPAAAAPPVIPFGSAPTQTTDAGGVPRVMTPASSSTPGVNPIVQQMQQQLMGGGMFAGTPAAAGGAGVFDPLAEAERMLGSRSPDDVDWGEAVRLASQAVGQPRQPAWQRFSS